MDRKPDNANCDPIEAFALERFTPYRLNDVAERASRSFATIYGERYGLSRPQWRCLATIGQFGRTTARRICEHSSMHKTKVSRAVFALEQRKWLVREADADDRRTEHLALTAAGGRVYRDLARAGQAYEDNLVMALGAENAAALMKGLAAIERILRSQRSDSDICIPFQPPRGQMSESR